MKRLGTTCLVAVGGSGDGVGHVSIGGGLASSSGVLLPMYSPLREQKCFLRNLHQYPHARYKSLVKDRRRFARNWWLTGGNNYELVMEVGHEREATENFGVYRDDSKNDVFLFSTNRLEDLPPEKRLNALVGIMKERWKVRDSDRGFDKAKLLLQALECFSEMRLLGQIKVFKSLPEADQDTFLQYVEGCVKFAQACAHSHPDSVAVMLRAAQICDDMRCEEKRDELLRMTELAARRMEISYAFARPRDNIKLAPPTLTDSYFSLKLRDVKTMKERFKSSPWVLENNPRIGYLRGVRGRRIYYTPMEPDDPITKMMQLHSGMIKDF
ncbi:unnamed protein product [Phytomonas sp. Hart1]|nr:unnamed protein product [Phytomonas sp. Hart1]|eukprot:CCW69983.1 unnamed protein product [Phytomonas sp. isolate Hart1]